MTKGLLASLYALRAQVEAVVAQVEDVMGVTGTAEPGSCPKCGALEEQVSDESTIGRRAFRCTKCGYEWEEMASVA